MLKKAWFISATDYTQESGHCTYHLESVELYQPYLRSSAHKDGFCNLPSLVPCDRHCATASFTSQNIVWLRLVLKKWQIRSSFYTMDIGLFFKVRQPRCWKCWAHEACADSAQWVSVSELLLNEYMRANHIQALHTWLSEALQYSLK